MRLSTQEKREQLTKEETQLRRKWDRLNKQAATDQRRVDAIQAELRRLEFVELVGKPGAVMLRYRQQPEDNCYHLNNLRGTVVELDDTPPPYALVDFGTAGASMSNRSGRWAIHLSDLAPSDKPQGETLNLGDRTP